MSNNWLKMPSARSASPLREHLLAHLDQRRDLRLRLLRLALDRQLREQLVEQALQLRLRCAPWLRSATGWPWNTA
jgi:hypothetical protein